MTDTAYERVTTRLAEVTNRQPTSSGDWPCPAHDDKSPSLSVSNGDGKVLLCCQAGCSTADVVAALGLEMADLFDKPKQARARVVATYDYTDEAGELLFQVVRRQPKAFVQRRPDGSGGWTYKLGDTRRVLFRLPAVLAAVEAGRTVYVVEGEKDVLAVEAAGAVATCNPAGAGKWRQEYAESLRGADVVVVADRDEPGRNHAGAVVASLRDVARSVRLVTPAEGKDVADHLGAGKTLDELIVVIDDAAAFLEAKAAGNPNPPVVVEDGAALLDELVALLCRFIAFPSPAAADAVALWAVHSHVLDAFESTPRLALLSPQKGSGKTRVLEVLELVCPKPMHAVNCTAAALFRAVAARKPTLLFDEADTYFGPKVAQHHEELRGLVNAGHRRGAVAYRCVGEGANLDVKEFPAFAAVALAGIGDLPDTVLDRAVVVKMRRRAPYEHVEPFRSRKAGPTGNDLRKRLAAWTDANRDALAEAEPAMPDDITDRPADVWESLVAIADAAGGEWPERARRAAVELNKARQDADPSLGVRLLADVRTIFDERQVDRISSATLVEALCALEESPWGDIRGKALDARGLAARLRTFEVRPGAVRFEVAVRKGYLREWLVDAWARYLPPSPAHPEETVTSVTALQPQVSGLFPVTPAQPVTDVRVTSSEAVTASEALTSTVTPVTPVTVLRDSEGGEAQSCDKCGASTLRRGDDGTYRHGICEPDMPDEWVALEEAGRRNAT